MIIISYHLPTLLTDPASEFSSWTRFNTPGTIVFVMNAACQCGEIRFTTPLPAPLVVYICHCLECRKQAASAFGTSAIFPAFSFPAERLGCFRRPTASEKMMSCYFCPRCGTRLIHAVDGAATISIKGGCLPTLDWAGSKHIWCKRAVVPIPDGVVRWDEEPDEASSGDGEAKQ